MSESEQTEGFYSLGPDMILDAIEAFGQRPDGSLLALNSYENRVYRVGIEDEKPIVAKFYRPGRWSDAAILEEHTFTIELAETEIPVVAPISGADGSTLQFYAGHRYALFPCHGGRTPELNGGEDYEVMGRFIGRIHAVAALAPFQHRPILDVDSFGVQSYQFITENNFIPSGLDIAYRSLMDDLLPKVAAKFEVAGKIGQIRLHGDCHPGNILWTDSGPHFVDLDDCRMGPAIQDLWMLLNGSRQDMILQLSDLLEGYQEFCDFDFKEVQLIEALRTLRIMNYAAWLARRWSDPAFPRSFPWFNTERYWEEHILTLREQFALLDEPSLRLN